MIMDSFEWFMSGLLIGMLFFFYMAYLQKAITRKKREEHVKLIETVANKIAEMQNARTKK